MRLLLIAILLVSYTIYIACKEETNTRQEIEKNLRNECLEYQHTEDDQVICIRGLSEEQINQILDR